LNVDSITLVTRLIRKTLGDDASLLLRPLKLNLNDQTLVFSFFEFEAALKFDLFIV